MAFGPGLTAETMMFQAVRSFPVVARSAVRRVIVPELLDSLPVNDTRAMASRRDLVRINAVMFQSAIMARLMRSNLERKPMRILEIGAGDGRFMLSVARRLGQGWTGIDLVTLDQADLVSPKVEADFGIAGMASGTGCRRCLRVDRQTGTRPFRCRSQPISFCIISGSSATGAVRCDAWDDLMLPRDRATTQRFRIVEYWLVASAWRQRVTLHDAAASVRAGFAGAELVPPMARAIRDGTLRSAASALSPMLSLLERQRHERPVRCNNHRCGAGWHCNCDRAGQARPIGRDHRTQ